MDLAKYKSNGHVFDLYRHWVRRVVSQGTKIVLHQCLWVECVSFAVKAHTGIEMAAKSGKTQSFETALAELEQVVADMESGKLTLEDSLAAYKRGAELLSFCRTRLDDAQQQVRVLEEGTLKDFTASGDAGKD